MERDMKAWYLLFLVAICTPAALAQGSGGGTQTATPLRNTWNAGPALKSVEEFQESLKKYPPIAPGTPDPYKPPK
jgi:hypothetical protein